jgi:hypothetical protein
VNFDAEGRPYMRIVNFYPENFFDKTVNESFIQKIMQKALQREDWGDGNSDRFEQDRLCGNVPFEFTIASDKRKKNTFVQKMQLGKYASEDVESDMFEYISTALEKKADKKYSHPNTHLSILCIEELTSWIFEEYDAFAAFAVYDRREEYFEEIKAKYLESGIFKNIFIIFPDIFAKWWVWDVKTNNKVSIRLSENDILSKEVPFVLEKNIYDQIIEKDKKKQLLEV